MPLKLSTFTGTPATLNKWADSVETLINDLSNRIGGLQKTTLSSLKTVNTNIAAIPGAVALPPDVTNFTATESDDVINGLLFAAVNFTATAPSPLKTFAGYRIYVQNYESNSSLVEVFTSKYTGKAGGTITGTFVLNRTFETVTLYFVAENSANETVSDWTKEPSTTVALGQNVANVTTPSVSESSTIVDTHTVPLLEFSWTNPTGNALAIYGGVSIYMKGYLGVNVFKRFWTKTADVSSFTDTLTRTGETVYFAFVSFDLNGIENPFTGSPGADSSISLVLNAQVSAPNTPQNVSYNPRPGAVELDWTENTEGNIQGYEVWRDTADLTSTPPTNFTLIKTIASSVSNGSVQYVDPIQSETTYRYSIRAFNTAGLRSAYSAAINATSEFNIPEQDNLIKNGHFQDWPNPTGTIAKYWTIVSNSNATFSQGSSSTAGQFSQKVVLTSSGSGTILSSKVPLKTNDFYGIGQSLNYSASVTAQNVFRIHFYNSTKTSDVYVEFGTSGATGSGDEENTIWILAPSSGDTHLSTGDGLLSFSGTLNFTPAYAAIETGLTGTSAGITINFFRVWLGEVKDPNNNQPLQAPTTNTAIFAVTNTGISWGAFNITTGGTSSSTIAVSSGSISGETEGTVYIMYYDTRAASAGVNATTNLLNIQKSYYALLAEVVTKLDTAAAPTLGTTAFTNGPATTYYVKVQYHRNAPVALGDLSSESSKAITAGNTVTVTSPSASTSAQDYFVWIGTATGSESQITPFAIPLGTTYTYPAPNTASITGGSGGSSTGGTSGGGGTDGNGSGTTGGAGSGTRRLL